MKLKKFQPLLEVLIAAILCFGIHNLFFYYNQNNPNYNQNKSSIIKIFNFHISNLKPIKMGLFIAKKL